MLPDRVSNPGPLTYELGALPIALRGPALKPTIMSLTHIVKPMVNSAGIQKLAAKDRLTFDSGPFALYLRYFGFMDPLNAAKGR